MSYYLALKLQVDFYLTYLISQSDLSRFIQTKPCKQLVHDIVTFLFQVQGDHYLNHLKTLVTLVEEQTLKDLIDIATSGNVNEAINDRLVEESIIYPRFLEYEATYWFISHYETSIYRYATAEELFRQLKLRFKNTWSGYYQSRACINNILFQSGIVIHLNIEKNEQLKQKLNHYLGYASIFNACAEKMTDDFWEFFLLAASHLRRKDFLALTEHVPDQIKTKDFFESANYENQFDNELSIDPVKFWLFCDRTNDRKLMFQCLARELDAKNYSYVRQLLQERQVLVKENTMFADLYIRSIYYIDGRESALAACESLAQYYNKSIEYIVLRVDILDLCNEVLLEELNYAFQVSCDLGIQQVSILSVSTLAKLLKKHNHKDDAISLLKQYCSQSDSLLFDLLELKIDDSNQSEECADIIKQLINRGFEHPLVYYYRGILEESKLSGAGVDDFEKSFKITSSVKSAYSALASRILGGKNKNDSILDYAGHSDNADLLAVVAQTYHHLQLPDQEFYYILKALIRTDSSYNKKIFGYFFMCSAKRESKKHKTVKNVQANTIVRFESNQDKSIVLVCFHQEPEMIPADGSNFAGCYQTSVQDADFLRINFHKVGDRVVWRENQYVIKGIEDRIAFFARYCIQKLIDNNDVIALSAENSESFLKQIMEIELARQDSVEEAIKQYETPNVGLPIRILAECVGRTIIETVNFLLSSEVHFYAGVSEFECTLPYIISASSICVLAYLGITDFSKMSKRGLLISHYTKKELTDDCTGIIESLSEAKGVLWTENGKPCYNEYTAEYKMQTTSNIANIIDIISQLTLTEELKPVDYFDEITAIKEPLGRADYEMISYAKANNMVIITDDLVVRRLANFYGIKSSTCIDVLVLLDLGYEKIIEAVSRLLTARYYFPITNNVLKYLSQQFEQLHENEDEFAKLAVATTTVFKKATEEEAFWPNITNEFLKFLVEEKSANETFRFFVRHFAALAKYKELEQTTQLENSNADKQGTPIITLEDE